MKEILRRLARIPSDISDAAHEMTSDVRSVVITVFVVVLVMGLAFAGSWLSDRAAGGPAARTNINRTNSLIEFQSANQGRTLCVSDISRAKDAALIDDRIAANRLLFAYAAGLDTDPYVAQSQAATRALLVVKASLALQPVVCPAPPPPTTSAEGDDAFYPNPTQEDR